MVRSKRGCGLLARGALAAALAAAAVLGRPELATADNLVPGHRSGFVHWLGDRPETNRAEFVVARDAEGDLTLEMRISGPPHKFRDVKSHDDKLTFQWKDYACELELQSDRSYEGLCESDTSEAARLTMDPATDTGGGTGQP